MVDPQTLRLIESLPCWSGPIRVAELPGGITNVNYRVDDAAGSFAVRLGADIPEHHVMRFAELAASKAAHAAGIAPAIRHHQPNVVVLDYVESRTLEPGDIGSDRYLPQVIGLIRGCHREVPNHLRGPAAIFWVFHVIRDYGATLHARESRHGGLIDELVSLGNGLEAESGPFQIVFGHNDLLAGNFLDDGDRLWLIDYDYAGFNTPLFDLGGLASNNGFDAGLEARMLESYFEAPATDALFHRYHAMKCASLLRETMWSMVSEITSRIDFDYSAYTAENLARFRVAHADFRNS